MRASRKPPDDRKKIVSSVELSLLTSCARRCCLCYGLRGDFGEKDGQIAHLNGNRADGRLANLAWLCFEHHNQFDSRTSQSKNLTPREIAFYKASLNRVVEAWRNARLPFASPQADGRMIKPVRKALSQLKKVEAILNQIRAK